MLFPGEIFEHIFTSTPGRLCRMQIAKPSYRICGHVCKSHNIPLMGKAIQPARYDIMPVRVKYYCKNGQVYIRIHLSAETTRAKRLLLYHAFCVRIRLVYAAGVREGSAKSPFKGQRRCANSKTYKSSLSLIVINRGEFNLTK